LQALVIVVVFSLGVFLIADATIAQNEQSHALVPFLANPSAENTDVAVQNVSLSEFANATEATPDRWQAAQRARALMPNATVTLGMHRLMWKSDPNAPALTLHGLLVTLKRWAA